MRNDSLSRARRMPWRRNQFNARAERHIVINELVIGIRRPQNRRAISEISRPVKRPFRLADNERRLREISDAADVVDVGVGHDQDLNIFRRQANPRKLSGRQVIVV